MNVKKRLRVMIIGSTIIVSLGLAGLTGCSQIVAKKQAPSVVDGNSIAQDSNEEKSSANPQVKVPVDIKIVENEQKSVDAGHSPWQLDAAFVAQVFVGLKISPEGIKGEYPIKYEAFKLIKNTDKEAIVKVNSDNTPISTVYLKRLVKKDSTGIWTVVGYDHATKE